MKQFLSLNKPVIAVFLVFIALAVPVYGESTGEIPSQSSENVEISPEIKEKFRNSQIGPRSAEKAEIMVGLENYEGAPGVEEMKKQSSENQQPLIQLAENNAQVEIKERFWLTNTVLLEADTNFPLDTIAEVQGVRRINPNAEVSVLDTESVETGPSSHLGSETYGLEQINATKTWDASFGSRGEGAKVSVIDTGIDPDHPDIELFTEDETDDAYPGGWAEFKSGEQDTKPRACEYGGGDHGIHVSGTVAGGDDSGTSIGVAPEAELMHVGALMFENENGNCGGFTSDVTSAMEWSIDNDASIISMSLGAPDSYVESYFTAVENARAANVTVIAAIGNIEGTSSSPGNVFTATSVGAVDESEEVADFSGGEEIDKDVWDDPPSEWPETYITPKLSGPGVDVYSADLEDDYSFKDGTSMATPHVSGAVALMQSATYEYLGPEKMEEALIETARTKNGDEQDVNYGYGIIDAYSATEYAVTNFDPSQLDAEDLVVEAGESASISVEVQTGDGNPLEEEGIKVNAVEKDGIDISDSELTDSSGVADFSFTETEASEYSLVFELDSNSDVSDVSNVQVEAGETSQLSFANQPVQTVAGELITDEEDNPLKVRGEDSYGNLNASFEEEVELKTVEDGKSLQLKAAVNGTAVFDKVNITESGEYELEATSGSLDKAESNSSFDVIPEEAQSIELLNQPSETTAGQIIRTGDESNLEVAVEDSEGNRVPDIPVNASLTEGNITSGDLEVETGDDGVAVFSNLVVEQAGSYGLNFSISDEDRNVAESVNVESDSFEVVADQADEFVFDKTREEVEAGVKADLGVQVLDAFGNPTTEHDGYNGVISVSEGSLDPSKVNISESENRTDFSWTHTETGNYTINTDTELQDNSHQITVKPAEISPEETTITSENQEITANGTSNTTITVQAKDEFENKLQTGGHDIELTTDKGKLIESLEDQENGQYTQHLQSSENLGTANITGTINQEEITDQTPVDFVAGPPETLESSVSGEATADGTDKIQITATIEDEFENPVKDTEVQLNETIEDLNLTGDGEGNLTNQQGETVFEASTTVSGNYTPTFTVNGLNTEPELTFNPGEPAEILFSHIDNQQIGEGFAANLTAVDEFGNTAPTYTNSSELNIINGDQNAELNLEETQEFTEGLLKDLSIRIDNNQTLQDLKLEASDTEIKGQSNEFNLQEPVKPDAPVFEANRTLLLEEEVTSLRFNESIYEFKDQTGNRKLEIINNNTTETFNQEDLGSDKEDFDWNKSYRVENLGDYTVNLTLTDIFDQEQVFQKNLTVREPVNVSTTISGSSPDWSFSTPEGDVRDQNQGSINTTLPSDDKWRLNLDAEETQVELQDVNSTEDVDETFDFQPDTSSNGEIDEFEEQKTMAADTGLEFSKVNITANVEAEKVYRCEDWSFDSESCEGSWNQVNENDIIRKNGQTFVEADGFSAYSFGDEKEEEEEEDDENGNDEEGDSNADDTTQDDTAPPPPPPSSDPELTVEETAQSINVLNVFEGIHSLEFSQTNLPITDLSFEAEETGSVNLTESPNHEDDVSFESVFEVETDLGNSFQINYTVSQEWLNENSFESSEVSLYKQDGQGSWGDQGSNQLSQNSGNIYLTSEITGSGVYGVGVDRACHSMEEVEAASEDSCQVYDNICEAPDNREVVDSCEVHQEKQDIQSQIDEKRSQEEFEPFSGTLDEAEHALERGDFEEAQEILSSLEESQRQSRLINQVVTALATLTVIAILASIGAWTVYKKKKRERLYSELEEVTEMVEELGEEGFGVERLFTEVKQVNKQLEHENYHAASTTMDQIREEIERKRR